MTTIQQAPARANKNPVTTVKPIAPSYAHVIRILNLVRTEADIAAIENELKRDIAMSYRLLRHINSAGLNFPREITSYRHAVTILGYHALYRWLTILLLTSDPQPHNAPLVKASIIRGRFLENVSQLCTPPLPRDPLFIVGVFSALDHLLGQPMETLLDSLKLSDDVNQALLNRTGPYGDWLRLAESMQSTEQQERTALEQSLGLQTDAVETSYEEAMTWCSGMLA